MKKNNFDLAKALTQQQNSPLGFGSEFKPPSIIQPLFHLHPNWNHVKSILSNGSQWPLEPISEEIRRSNLEEALAFGNHKGATDKPELLKELCNNDVVHGYALVLPLDKARLVKGLTINPMNIANQHTIDEHGQIIEKDRLTHNQSFRFQSGKSVNDRVDKEKLSPCLFGAVNRRLINWTCAARHRYPNIKIKSGKTDFKSAYRREHLAATEALSSSAQIPEKNLLLIPLRLTFGGTACPSEWCSISEMVTDLANAILHEPDWDPHELFAPELLSIPTRPELPDEIPFGQAEELIVNVPLNEKGQNEMFIDDNCALTLDLPGSDNVVRMERA
jgi:hypothetical protein